MKKLLLLLVLPLLFTACKDDDDKNEQEDIASYVIGKKYVAYLGDEEYFYIENHIVKVYGVYRFIDNNTVEYTERINHPEGPVKTNGSNFEITYTLEYPNLIIARGDLRGNFIDKNTIRTLESSKSFEYILYDPSRYNFSKK